ncbi:hypothetical protein FHS27_006585 [Rhodopirellula rubra]|uniref:DUF7716 domain-containing protein n=1 Tax=Aporhodopirellula rubra TaxID=980271 RepID=A0A7W5E7H5_9BACT|nr:hypothetical protein [Aporhodopirellula rubra]MBB3210737.1 hypothetical protein [Aporhodopirellula rubra]
MTTLEAIIQRLRSNDASDDDWLYVAGDFADLSLSTDADLGSPSYDEDTDEESHPPEFTKRGLCITIDRQTADQCIAWADRLAEAQDNAAAADIIRYYIRFDAWPETLGAPDPPPTEEVFLRMDREFCDMLGDERKDVACKRDGCDRGAVPMSVLCRRHHFENVKGRPYPFED